MSSKQLKSEKSLPHRADLLLPEHLLKLGVPGTLTRLKEIVDELEKQQNDLELQQDELEKARNDLKLLLDQYTNLYDSAPVGYLTLNRSGLILQINPAGAHLFGMERSSLINQNLQRYISADSWPEYATFLEKIFNNQSQEILEFKLQRQDDKITVHIVARENKEEDSCIATLIDVTAEEQSKLLRKEEHKYRMIFENISHGIVLCGLDGKIVSANQAAKNILGLTFKQMETRPLLEIFSNPINEDGQAFSEKTLPFMKLIPSIENMQGTTIGYLPKNSTYYTWIVVSAMAITMPDEDDVQFLISFDDITSQKNLVLYNTLTLREKQVFQMLVKGYSRKEIAKNLDITPKTVDKHRENLMEKLNIFLPEELLDFYKHF
jgi:PAS domain S-box-containing protein